ncbi:MAG: protein-export chaperone SecB [Hyphomicrobiales bacterium]
MADNNETAGFDEQAMPQFHILAQYLKDLSFENPNAPASLQPKQQQPQIQIGVNVNGQPRSETDFEVSLKIEARGGSGNDVLFNIEVEYGGLVRVQNVPPEHVHATVLIEGPRLLFPFVRQIVADATRNGGFPPLMIDPIDFAQLYRQRMVQAENEMGAGQAN